MNIIYCLVPKTYWQNYVDKAEYFPRDYEQEGFIHATKGDDLLVKVANRVYTDFVGELFLLVIDEDRVTSEIKYEQAKDGLDYPHIYGALNTDAIVGVKQMSRINGVWMVGEEYVS